jgi:hypothetical protein
VTLAQRFSESSPSPITFFSRKRANEAVERGEFIGLHDVGGVDLNTDMNYGTLESEFFHGTMFLN